MKIYILNVLGISTLLIIAGIIFFLPILYEEVGIFDEGLILTGAQLVLEGKIPYRDFSAAYSPGQYYLIGAWFGMFGKSVAALRVFEIFQRSLIALICFWICRRLSSALIAFLCYAAMLIWLTYVGCYGYPIFPFLLFAFLSLLVLGHSAKTRSRKGHTCAGLLAGMACLFRHDMGSLFITTISVLLASLSLRTYWIDRSAMRLAIQGTVLFITSALTPLVLAFGALVLVGSGHDMFEQIVRYPLFSFVDYRGLPYPSVQALLNIRQESLFVLAQNYWYITPFFLFPLIVACSATLGAKFFLSKRKLKQLDYTVIFLTGTGISCLPQAFGRSDFWHLIPLGFVSIILSYLLLTTLWHSTGSKVAGALLLVFTGFWWIPIHDYRIPRGGTITPLSPETAQVVSFLNAHHKGERIYVGAENHDRMVVNAPAIYFLADVKCGTKYYSQDPGIVTTEKVQMEIINELLNNDIRVIVLSKSYWEEPNRSSQDLGINKLDQFIQSNFSLALENRSFDILVKEPTQIDFNSSPIDS